MFLCSSRVQTRTRKKRILSNRSKNLVLDVTALKEEETQEDEREYEEAWKKIKDAWNSEMGEEANKKSRPMKPGDTLSDEGTEFNLSTILRDLRAMWTISAHTACTLDKCNVRECQRAEKTKKNPINPSTDKSLETYHVEMPERTERDFRVTVRVAEACIRSKSENLKKEEIAVAAIEETDIMEDRNNHEGEINCEKTVPRKAYCFNCGEETEKSKKCRGCRKAR